MLDDDNESDVPDCKLAMMSLGTLLGVIPTSLERLHLHLSITDRTLTISPTTSYDASIWPTLDRVLHSKRLDSVRICLSMSRWCEVQKRRFSVSKEQVRQLVPRLSLKPNVEFSSVSFLQRF